MQLPYTTTEILTCAFFLLDWDGLFGLLQALDVTANGILGHPSRVLQILAFRHKSREGGDRHRVAAVFVRLEKGRVFTSFASGSFHLFILDQDLHHTCHSEDLVLVRRISLFCLKPPERFFASLRMTTSCGEQAHETLEGAGCFIPTE